MSTWSQALSPPPLFRPASAEPTSHILPISPTILVAAINIPPATQHILPTTTNPNMKFSLTLASLCLTSLVAADFGISFGGSQTVLDDKGEAIPGNNPLVHCKKEHSSNILVLDHVNLTPNPPTPYVYSHSIYLCRRSGILLGNAS